MASGSLLVILKTRKHYVRGADKVINIRDSLKRLCEPRTEDLSGDTVIPLKEGMKLVKELTEKYGEDSLGVDAKALKLVKAIVENSTEISEEWRNILAESATISVENLRELARESDQTAKADKGKPRLSLVPTRAVEGIARIREYGCNKYPVGGQDNWKDVEPQRYIDALLRHAFAFKDDPCGVDEESGLPHLWHLMCNGAFLCELLGDEIDGKKM